jgi:antitoxin VapB
MTLHIDDPEADRLARELAEQIGAPMDQAVVKALRAQLAREREAARKMERIREIQEHFASLPILDDRSDDEILGYDENGLPT